MSRSINTQLEDGLTIEYAGHTHRFYRVTVEDTTPDGDRTHEMICYEIVREDDNAWMGRVSQYVRQDRVIALIRRRYEPEDGRIQPFQFGGTLRMSRKKRYDVKTLINGQNTVPPVWYIAIPRQYVQRFDIRVDDEIQVHIGDTKPDGPIDELYHVSMQNRTCIVVLSKLWRTTGRKGDKPADKGRSSEESPQDPEPGDISPYVFHDGEYRTVRIRPHRSPSGNWDLCYWYGRVSKDKTGRYLMKSETWDVKNRRPKGPGETCTHAWVPIGDEIAGEDGTLYQWIRCEKCGKKKRENTTETLNEPMTNFNDW